jgi:hypothetical protein
MCLTQKGKNQSHDSSRRKSIKRERGKKNFMGRGVKKIKVRGLIFTVFLVEIMGHMKRRHEKYHGKISRTIRNKGKDLESTHFVVVHCNIGINPEIFSKLHLRFSQRFI